MIEKFKLHLENFVQLAFALKLFVTGTFLSQCLSVDVFSELRFNFGNPIPDLNTKDARPKPAPGKKGPALRPNLG